MIVNFRLMLLKDILSSKTINNWKATNYMNLIFEPLESQDLSHLKFDS